MTGGCVRVKICGIRDLETAKVAVEAGADALGFVFAGGRRRISPVRAREIIKELPPFVSRVGVFINPTLKEVLDIAAYAGLDTIQLHGGESPEFCRKIRHKVIKAFPVSEKIDPDHLGRYKVDAYLLDTPASGAGGGTGRMFDWRLAAGFPGGPLILAGGLTPDNVREAVEFFRPYAVDVSSGVEAGGRKDPQKIIEFVRRVKG